MLFLVPAMSQCNLDTNKIENSVIGRVHSLETFGSVDGPGVRFVVFLQGCAMRCRYCHNPETWAMGGEEWSAQQLFDRAWKYHNYWGKNLESGGITVSGGEPLLQIDFVTEFFKIAKKHGVHTAIDTAGQPFTMAEPFISKFKALLEVTDLFILDLKEIDDEKHKSLTGHSNSNILQMAQYLSDNGVPMWIRHVLVPNLTDDEDGLKKTADFIGNLKTVKRVEILPYHTLGLFKWEKLGIEYSLKDCPTPTSEQVEKAKDILKVDEYSDN